MQRTAHDGTDDTTHRTEVRNGRVFTVTVLPEVKPRRNRSARTPFHSGKVSLWRDNAHITHPLPPRMPRAKRL